MLAIFVLCMFSATLTLVALVVAVVHTRRSTNGSGGDGGSATPTAGAIVSPKTFPDKVFAPYWDVSAPDVPWKNCPAKYITLAFVLGNASGAPVWNGTEPISSKVALVNRIRAAGKDVIISFGGQTGTELGQVITDVAKLADAYIAVIDALGAKWIDLDIEGSSTADTQAVIRRHKAIVKVQKARPGVTVSYTLPVMPDGLPPNEYNFMRAAKDAGVRVDVVNIMTMDYGPSFTGDMGAYAIDAAKNVHAQLERIGLRGTKVGICPMIGVNDIQAEVFTVSNARAVREFAQKTPWVRWLAFWSINRDNESAAPSELYRSSGIKQRNWEFSQEFAKL